MTDTVLFIQALNTFVAGVLSAVPYAILAAFALAFVARMTLR